MNKPYHPDRTLITKPKWLAVHDLVADAQDVDLEMDPKVARFDDGFKKLKKEDTSKAEKAKKAEQEKKDKEAEEKTEVPEDSEAHRRWRRSRIRRARRPGRHGGRPRARRHDGWHGPRQAGQGRR